jgi:hypothetical protein
VTGGECARACARDQGGDFLLPSSTPSSMASSRRSHRGMDGLSQVSAQGAGGGDADRAGGKAAADLQGRAPQPLVDEDPFLGSWVSSSGSTRSITWSARRRAEAKELLREAERGGGGARAATPRNRSACSSSSSGAGCCRGGACSGRATTGGYSTCKARDGRRVRGGSCGRRSPLFLGGGDPAAGCSGSAA